MKNSPFDMAKEGRHKCMRRYILVAGYGWSGSSTIADFVREFSVGYGNELEFDVIRNPYGLLDLEVSLVQRWNLLYVDIAIKNFLWLVKNLNETRGRFKLSYGEQYEKIWGKKFLEISHRFVERLTSFQYRNSWYFLKWQESKMDLFFEKILRILRLWPFFEKIPDAYYIRPMDHETFCRMAREYINELIDVVVEKNVTHVCLDQAIPVQYIQVAHDYFEDWRAVVVDRDPRDIYVNMIKRKTIIGMEFALTHDVSKFITWFLDSRRNQEQLKNMENVKFYRFEKLVNEYENCCSELIDFLGLDESQHILKKKYFNPDVSRKKIGMWKTYPRQEEIRIIERDLKEYINE